MELTEKQKVGLDTALFRYNHGLGYTVIAGYAGTGKSTLVKFIVSALHIPEDDIVYCAYTGKACKVLQQKGNNNVLTLHKLLYTFQALPDGTYIQKPKTKLDYHFIIVDECSMLPQEMVDLLLKYMDTYIIAQVGNEKQKQGLMVQGWGGASPRIFMGRCPKVVFSHQSPVTFNP